MVGGHAVVEATVGERSSQTCDCCIIQNTEDSVPNDSVGLRTPSLRRDNTEVTRDRAYSARIKLAAVPTHYISLTPHTRLLYFSPSHKTHVSEGGGG